MNEDCKNLWTERYRPTKLSDLCISDEIRKKVLDWGNEIPHLLLIGNAGVGKTTLARILVQDILDCDYLYINASDENGIDTIRTKVTGFVQTKSLDGNIKVVILDEADGLTADGQKCLRNLMESYANTARFILTGNYRHKVLPAVQSRCQRLDLTPSLKDAFMRCLDILKMEGVVLDADQRKLVAKLVKRHFPDIRMCIGELSKHCIGNELNIVDKTDNSELCDEIFKRVLSKQSLHTRKKLIEGADAFNSDWDQLMIDLLNHIYKVTLDEDRKRNMIVTIADHLDKSARAIDKEINFFACLLNIEIL